MNLNPLSALASIKDTVIIYWEPFFWVTLNESASLSSIIFFIFKIGIIVRTKCVCTYKQCLEHVAFNTEKTINHNSFISLIITISGLILFPNIFSFISFKCFMHKIVCPIQEKKKMPFTVTIKSWRSTFKFLFQDLNIHSLPFLLFFYPFMNLNQWKSISYKLEILFTWFSFVFCFFSL